jgi:EmrB/QacA subfamily drug resistance transporter
MPAHSKTRRPLVIASIMAAMFMVAIEATIVSTAMPQIVGQLGGLHLYSWVFSAFLLTQTATTVIFGKLSDVYGRKPVLLGGILVFLVGSVLCGVAWSMPAMIAFRLIQGVGAGAIQPVALTVVGDLYSAQERGRIQGWLASVWGVSAVLGPLAGGLIIRNVSWAWIFWVNIPIGIAAAIGFIAYLHEDVAHQTRPIDLAGATLFTVAVAALMVASTQIGTTGWVEAVPAVLVFAVSVGLFVLQERRAPEPMVALELWSRRPIAAANAATLLAGMALIGLTTFLPMYVQGVLGQSPLIAGFALTMMVLGWPLGSIVAARAFTRIGMRPTLLLGSVLIPAGAVFFVLLSADTPAAVAGVGSLIMGFGMGLLSTSGIVLIQEIVPWSERGSATASNIFSRNLGSTLGATVFGAVLNYGLVHFGRPGATVTSDQLRELLESTAGLGADTAVRDVLGYSLHLTFWAVFAVALGIVVAAWLVPAVSVGRRQEAAAE